jgi:hypothetical protein
MLQWIGALIVALIWPAPMCHASSALDQGDSDAPSYRLTRTVIIPLKVLEPSQAGPPQAKADPSVLLVTPGAEDELPEGPNGFEVLGDGRLLISDPLANRLAVFDIQGKFRGSWNLDFSPDSLTLIGNNTVAVRDAATGQLHGFSQNGQPQSLPNDTAQNVGEVQLKSRNTAVVTPPATSGKHARSFEFTFDRPGMSLLSVEALGVDSNGDTYVAVESTKGGDEVTVQKDVRKYSASGKLLGQILDIRLDYYITPVNELRVRNGTVYQLDTTKFEVRVNIWTTK